MSLSGYYDKEVGIIYSIEKSNQYNSDIWFTTDEFTFYVGEIVNRRSVTIPKGFLTDGASVPSMFWGIFPPWGIYGQAAIVHDYLCVTNELTDNNDKPLKVTIEEIDSIFYSAMKAAGTPIWKRSLIYAGVKLYHYFRP